MRIGTGLRVVMVVADDVTRDTRVRTEASALAVTGAQVTVLGVAANGLPSKEVIGGAMIVRVAVPYELRAQRDRSRKARRDWRPPLAGYRHGSTYAARVRRIRAGLMEVKADSGAAIGRARPGPVNLLKFKAGVAARLLRRARWQAAQRAALVRKRAGTAADRSFKSGWRAYDGLARRLPWPARWRTLHPEAFDLETAFGELIDRLEPDVVHAHTVQVIGVAVRAAGRAKLRGRSLTVVYDAHEDVAGGPGTRRSVVAWANHEAEYIGAADGVITASPAIATRLQREHRLQREPTVVMDTPDPAAVSIEAPDVSWSGQAAKLRALYAELTGRRLEVAGQGPEKTGRRLLIGPLNSAGQAYQWATAAERNLKGVTAESLSIRSAVFRFPVHYTATEEQYRSDLRWQLELTDHVLRDVTHVIFEAGRTMFGAVRGQVWTAEVPTLDQAGIRHAVLFHGSEIRDPALHRARHPHSPFRDPDDELTRRLQTTNDMLRGHLQDYQGPVFVSTPDLLEYVDNGIWLPLALDVEGFAANRPVLERKVPVVLHAPTSGPLKGSSYVDPVLAGLDAQGLIKYQRVQNVAHAELTEMVRNADIVVEQLLLGLYGVSACEAMAAGRVTVGYVPDRIRELLPAELPIVEATPDGLAEVIERLVHEREEARKIADAGPRYVRDLHDGRRSAEALLPFLNGELA
ncbi:glycosyltransferase [Kribbella sp. NPDC051587]|uniref:glycosyltransferase n=1 Tax=Kribbella sp. NPDC051587 TaxID=3364119 RepID=UPI0037BD3C31